MPLHFDCDLLYEIRYRIFNYDIMSELKRFQILEHYGLWDFQIRDPQPVVVQRPCKTAILTGQFLPSPPLFFFVIVYITHEFKLCRLFWNAAIIVN